MLLDNDLSYIKSTVDKLGLDLAHAVFGANADALDLDSDEQGKLTIFSRSRDAVVWKILDFSSHNIPSLRNITIGFGTSLQKDKNNAKSIAIAGEISKGYCEGGKIEVFNYIPTQPPFEKVGVIGITNVDLNPQLYDGIRAYRMVTITGAYVRGG